MTTPNPKSPVLTATEADAALAAAQRLEGNVTVGEALKHWGTIPQEDRDRLLETCRETRQGKCSTGTNSCRTPSGRRSGRTARKHGRELATSPE